MVVGWAVGDSLISFESRTSRASAEPSLTASAALGAAGGVDSLSDDAASEAATSGDTPVVASLSANAAPLGQSPTTSIMERTAARALLAGANRCMLHAPSTRDALEYVYI